MRIEGEMLAGHKYAEQHLKAILFAANEIMNDTNAFAQSALQGSPQQQRNHRWAMHTESKSGSPACVCLMPRTAHKVRQNIGAGEAAKGCRIYYCRTPTRSYPSFSSSLGQFVD